MTDDLFNFVADHGVSLHSSGVNSYVLSKSTSLELIELLTAFEIAVVGGDVYTGEDNEFVATYDSWYIQSASSENVDEYVARSLAESKAYIEGYVDSAAYFALVIGQQSNKTVAEELVRLMSQKPYVLVSTATNLFVFDSPKSASRKMEQLVTEEILVTAYDAVGDQFVTEIDLAQESSDRAPLSNHGLRRIDPPRNAASKLRERLIARLKESEHYQGSDNTLEYPDLLDRVVDCVGFDS